MNDTKVSRSETAIVNQNANVMYTIVASVLLIAYAIQFFEKAFTPLAFGLLVLLDVGPLIASWVIFKANEESGAIRHLMAYGYGAFVLLCCFVSEEQMVFTYIIPMIIVVAMFNDFKFSVRVSVGAFVIALVHAIKITSAAGWTKVAIAAFEIEVAVMALVAIFSVLCNRITCKINDSRVAKIDEAGLKTTKMLEEIVKISGALTDKVSKVSERMTQLTASSEETLASMQEVQSGSSDSAESVQKQLVKTEEIQTQIDKVSNTSTNISENVDITVEATRKGRDNVSKLISQSEISERAGTDVMNEVEELKKSTAQMESIVEMIKSVANQTSLLSLNASIEAARAGEAGRGFAVVATEISDLASQTSTATGNITELINGISAEMTDVVSAISSLVDSNKIQNESAHVTAESFEQIVESIRSIRSGSQELSDIVGTLKAANEEIVESIQTISAITEEVSAHSTTTSEAVEQNERVVEEVQSFVQGMIEDAEKLNKLK